MGQATPQFSRADAAALILSTPNSPGLNPCPPLPPQLSWTKINRKCPFHPDLTEAWVACDFCCPVPFLSRRTFQAEVWLHSYAQQRCIFFFSGLYNFLSRTDSSTFPPTHTLLQHQEGVSRNKSARIHIKAPHLGSCCKSR